MRKSFVKKIVPLLCLVLAVFVFSSCENATDAKFYDRQFIPVGTWVSDYDDSYTIERGNLAYTSTYSGTWVGIIMAAVDFSPASGVLIVKYTTPPDGDYSGHASDKDYTGVYYTGYSSHFIQLADAWLPGDPYPTERAELSSLNEALDTFTEGNMGTHVSSWGSGYNK